MGVENNWQLQIFPKHTTAKYEYQIRGVANHRLSGGASLSYILQPWLRTCDVFVFSLSIATLAATASNTA